MFSDLGGDLRALAEVQEAKFGAIVRAFVTMPAQAGPALWAMPMTLHELRSIVTSAVVATMADPVRAEDVRDLMPLVRRLRRREDLRAILGQDDLEARALLWVLAVTWSLPPYEPGGGDA